MAHLHSEDSRVPNQRLRQARLHRGWSQQQLADRVGTTAVTVKRWERGSQSPSPYFRLKLCGVFDLGETELGLNKQEGEEKTDALPQQKPLQKASSLLEEGDASGATGENDENALVAMGQAPAGEMTGRDDHHHATSASSSWLIPQHRAAGGQALPGTPLLARPRGRMDGGGSS